MGIGAFCGGVAVNVCSEAIKLLVIQIYNPITLVFRCRKNVRNLDEKLNRLSAKEVAVEHQITEASGEGKEIEKEATDWMGEANEYTKGEKKNSIDGLKREAFHQKCCFGCCPNPCPRYELSKKAVNEAQAVEELLKRANEIKIGYFPDQEEEEAVPDKDFVNFDSRMAVLEDIMEALRSPSIKTIGVHGMAGMGKRMLVKEAKRKAEKFFDKVVMASVTMESNFKEIQEEIAGNLVPRLPIGSSMMNTANLIKPKLTKKRVLVILVDIWRKIDLMKLGIPNQNEQKHPREEKEVAISFGNKQQPTERRNKENSSVEEPYCKILMTSTNLDVLLRDMHADKIIEVPPLEYPDALELFRKMVCKNVERTALPDIATKIVQECGGLPLAITAVGDALSTKTRDDEWLYALEQLKSQTPSERLNSAIEFSFKQLKGDELWKTFFLCSLLGSSASVEDLLKYAVGLDLFRNVHSIQEARARATTLINELKGSSLLVDGRTHMHFHVINEVRRFARIVSKDHGVLVFRDGNTPAQFSDMEAMQKLKWIYSSCPDISQLAPLAKNPQSGLQQLEFFHLSNLSAALPENFFRRMEKLRVLDLVKMHLLSMPSSISHLTTLCTLRLDQSVLPTKDIAVIGELQNLQVLSLVGCDIEVLPEEIAKLSMLKLLDLTDCSKLKVIPPDVIARLSRLEELKMRNNFDRWEVRQHGDQTKACLDELSHLQNLTALEVCISDAKTIPNDFFSEKLKRYKIFIEVEKDWKSSFEGTRVLKLKMNPSYMSNDSFRKFLKMTDELHMDKSSGAQVVDELDYEGFQDLKYLSVLNDQSIQQISTGSVTSNPFPKLEVLSLHSLANLQKIFQGWFTESSFKKLRVITVEFCNQLKNLFSFVIARQLQLQEIKVSNCDNITEIVADEEQRNTEAIEKVDLVQLRSLKLQNLRQLVCFCHEKNSASSSRGIPIFTEKVMFPKIEELQLSQINVNSIWHTSMESSCVNNLMKLNIVGCNNLDYIFSSSMARGLLKIRYLEIRECKSLSQVLFSDNVEDGEKLIFAQLNFLHIKDLQNFIGFYSGSCIIEFQSLKELRIENCPKLKEFNVTTDATSSTQHLFNKQVAFPKLERITISHLKKLEIMWQNQLFANSFCKLKTLEVSFCENLSTIFPSGNMLERFWKSLEELTITGCGSLKVLFELEEFNFIKSDAAIVTQLRILEIRNLPGLEYVWTKNAKGIISFENLKSVLVYNCPSLKNLFPASVARMLKKLQKLRIKSCGVEEIVAMEGRVTEAVVRFEFPGVYCLILDNLPRLKYFYPEEHTTKWQGLKKFYFNHPGGVKKINWRGGLDFPVQQPLFSVKEVVPHLEKLSLTGHDIAMICKGQFKIDFFDRIKVLRIQSYYEDESDILPISFLNQFHNLKKLVLNSFFNDLFYAKELDDDSLRPSPLADVLFSPSSEIDVESQEKHLEELSLKHIWRQDATVLHKLKTLKAWQCDRLTNLSTLLASCWNLTTLDVWNCQGMEYLFSVSTTKSLVQLISMTVRQCYMLTVIDGDGDGTEDLVINFGELRYLKLECLTRLESFCFGKFTFNFPYLDQLVVDQCPELKMFCGSVPSTPKLKQVQSIGGEDKWLLSGDLNTTLKQMYNDKVGYAALKYLRLTDFPVVMKNWHESSQEILNFRVLQSLEICGFSNLEYLLTRSIVQDLVQLVELKVINCSRMCWVIQGDRLENEMNFPLLRFIYLESCSNLACFYLGSCTLDFPSLVRIVVADCPKMATFASTFSREQDKEASPYFFNNKVEFPNLEVLKFSPHGSLHIQEIWHSSLPELSSSVKNLTKFIVHGCDNLKYLFTFSMVESFVQLNSLEICCCKMMERVIATEGLAEKESMCRSFLPTLHTLQLEDLPRLTGFCSSNYIAFSYLTQLQISKCPVLKTFISSEFTRDMTASQNVETTYAPISLFDEKVLFPSLERLTISQLGSFNKIWHNQPLGSFPQLTYLSVDSCQKLLNIFPFGIWKRLEELDTLLIHKCDSLKEIFEPGQGSSSGQSQALVASQLTSIRATLEFVFSKLTQLKLYNLPNLKCFYPQLHTAIEFSSLRKLEVYGCNEIQMFASEFQSFQRISGDDQLEIQSPDPLFWVDEATFPSLEQLKLEWNIGMKNIWAGENSGEYFPRLKVLELIHFHEQSTDVSSFVRSSLPNLEKLVVNDTPINEIFDYEGLGDDEKPTHLLSKILAYFWKKDRQRIPVPLNYLTSLEVHDCSKLKNLGSKLVYFKNLHILEVSKCHGLTNLVRYSTATSLMQLKRMIIRDCHMIEEVVACEDSEVKDGIVFDQLQCLQLCHLPRLSRFCSVKCKPEFPSLEELNVMECPKMKILPRGKLSTAKLQKVLSTGDRWLWKGNLNSTIQKFFTEKVIMSDNLLFFIISLFINLIIILSIYH